MQRYLDSVEIAKLLGLAGFSIVSGFAIYKTIKIYKVARKYENIPGPEPKSFYFGNIKEFLEAKKNGLHFAQFFENLVENYGSTVKLRFIDQVFVLTIEPSLIKELFIDENYPKNEIAYTNLAFPLNERFLGNGLVTERNHDLWKEHRAFINPGFQRQALITFTQEFNATGDMLMVYLRKFADGKTKVKLLDEFNRATLDIIARVGFSMNIDSINDHSNQLSQYIKETFEFVQLVVEDPLAGFNPFLWRTISKRKKTIRKIRNIGREQIIKRIEALKNSDPVPNDILTTILTSSFINKKEVDIEFLVDDFVTFFIAGQETTATTLSFVFRELSRNPEVLEKLRKEVDTVIGSKSEIEFTDLAELKYTGAVIKETLRLFPAVVSLSRTSTKEVKMKNFTIPKDTWIVVSTYVNSRREEYFSEPLKFNPERFLKDESNNHSTTFGYFPFSIGPRNCIGQNFSQMEMKIIITKFIQNFNFRLNPEERFQEETNTTLHPKDGTTVFLELR